jgi:hypothetical protein
MRIIAFLLFCMVSANCQVPTAKVTFFREHSTSVMKRSLLFQYQRDAPGPGTKWDIYVDGKKLATLRRERIVTFAIAPGHHDFKTDDAPMISIDVEKGSHIFFRTVVDTTKNKHNGFYTFRQVKCEEFVASTSTIKPVKANDIFTGTVVPFSTFAHLCSAE